MADKSQVVMRGGGKGREMGSERAGEGGVMDGDPGGRER